ncbi:hypothetical protein Scep_001863 [Stephania cephalantha]|uniref:Remorin C-terminal domain-containing protein n=1 Tax=Stephania cephalantha TaxID=152367 RepID=A0AAP0Q3S2_9MAGN
MKLEKKRLSSMDRIMKNLRLAQRKAQEMRTSISANQSQQIIRASNRTLSFQEVVASLDMPSSPMETMHMLVGCEKKKISPQPQRRPKAKSGPLGPPGLAYRLMHSASMPVFQDGSVRGFLAGSPFSSGVMAADGLIRRSNLRNGGGGASTTDISYHERFGISASYWDKNPLARARPRLGTSKVAPCHGQGIPWQGLTNLDLGVDPGGLSQGRDGHGSKEDPRACLGHHAKARPSDPWSGHPVPNLKEKRRPPRRHRRFRAVDPLLPELNGDGEAPLPKGGGTSTMRPPCEPCSLLNGSEHGRGEIRETIHIESSTGKKLDDSLLGKELGLPLLAKDMKLNYRGHERWFCLGEPSRCSGLVQIEIGYAKGESEAVEGEAIEGGVHGC